MNAYIKCIVYNLKLYVVKVILYIVIVDTNGCG